MRVMIVEDQVMIRGLLETYFTKENGDQIVAGCRTGRGALQNRTGGSDTDGCTDAVQGKRTDGCA